ncbi:MAG: carbohydrate ABC transporter permease [Bacilli bacterium]
MTWRLSPRTSRSGDEIYKKDTQAKIWNDSKISLLFLGMAVLAIVLLFPYVFMVNKSLMTSERVIDPNPKFFPDWADLQWSNFITLFTTKQNDLDFGKALLNTFIIIAFDIIAIPLSSSMAAFAFAKLEWKGKNAIFASMMLTITLPGIVTQIPLYVIYSKIGWLNTLLPFTIPNLFGGGAMYIFLIRQYMMGIPNELIDAAKIDGCGNWRIYWNIILPNCRTILIYIMVTVFMSYWGDYYGPLVFMNSSDAPYTFAYALFKSSVEGDASTSLANIRMAGGVFMTLIPTILFTVFQKELTNGALTSGLKG